MNRKSFLLTAITAVMLVAGNLFMTGCTKEGPAGLAGKDGANGVDGADGTTNCIACHSSNQAIFAIEKQWANSMHATGTAFERNAGECAVCHTSQGFRGNLDGSYDWQAEGAMISNPTSPNCYTCHKIHENYDAGDIAFTVSGPIVLRNTNGSSHDFGKGSLCASCHQGRTVSPFPVTGGDDITVTSSRYGVHHGPQANTFAGVGKGLFEIGSGLVNSAHSTQIADACVTCHMSEAFGASSGGHAMWMGETLNTASCETSGCHEGEEVEAMTEAFQTEISDLLADLKLKLDAAGITNAGSDNSVAGTYPAVVAGACLDYKALTEDKSLGVHNPKYIKKLVENLIEAL